MGYILLYSLTLYDVTESQLREWKATEKDIVTIKKVNILDNTHLTPHISPYFEHCRCGSLLQQSMSDF